MKKKITKILESVPWLYFVGAFFHMLYLAVKHRSLKMIVFSPPGHFYSTIPSMKEVGENSAVIFDKSKPVLGVSINEDEQLSLLREFSQYYGDLPFSEQSESDLRYYYNNPFFGYGDGIVLYSFLRHFKPSRVVEVGSGYSSALMLDTDESFLNGETEFVFIEPYSERLRGLLRKKELAKLDILESPVQSVDKAVFTDLNAGDILFIDSSHVVKIGSDVDYLLSQILPVLKPGVIIHFHDVLWPFEYPESWVRQGRSWNEAYFIRTFLQYNSDFEIMVFNSYIGDVHPKELALNLPLCSKMPGGSIWLRKVL